MKSPRAALVATAIPLILTSLRVTAGELPFNAPTTEQAKESAPLLHQTAQALYDSFAGASGGPRNNKQISHLWLFPTADTHTVFARYNLTSTEEGASGITGTTEHLDVLTIDGNRIVESRELTSSAVKSVSRDSTGLDWSAAIGTGHVAHPDMTNTSHGVPASPHWTASIGTGATATAITAVGGVQQPSSASAPVVAAPHWTARIGRGDAVDSTRPAASASLANAR
jgi:hypothetical protein